MYFIYNSRNYKGLLIKAYCSGIVYIYNSRNYKGLLILSIKFKIIHIYNSRNYKGLLIPWVVIIHKFVSVNLLNANKKYKIID